MDLNKDHQEYLWHGERRAGHARARPRLPRPRSGGDGSLSVVVVILFVVGLTFFSYLPVGAAWPLFAATSLVVGWFSDAITGFIEALLVVLLLGIIFWCLTSLVYIAMI